MIARRSRLTLLPAVLLCALPLAPALSLHAQERGSLVGIVFDDLSGEPVTGAVISLIGTDQRAETNEAGEFMFPQVAAGTVAVRIEGAGYSGMLEHIELQPDGVADLEIHLQPMAVLLDELLVRGRRERDEPSYAVGEIRSERPSGFTAADLLAASVPGLSIGLDRGFGGGGASVSLRGHSSISQPDTPQIYVDGILITEPPSGSSFGGRQASNILRQIPARDVARIRVLRGPAATGLFPNAANGVILIETVHAATDLPDR